MSVMFTHAMIAPDSHDIINYKFIPNALHPFDQMKFILEQYIYCDYLMSACGVSMVTNDFSKTIDSYYKNLPNKILTRDNSLNSLYLTGIELIERFKTHSGARLNDGQCFDLYRIFAHAPMQTYYNNLYTSTMNKMFLDEYLFITTYWVNEQEFPDLTMYECALFVPQMTLTKGCETEQRTPDVHQAIVLTPRIMESFGRKNQSSKWFESSFLGELIEKFDMRRYSLDELIGMLAGFSLDHSKYVMTNNGIYGSQPSFADICYDLVTGSSFVDLDSAGKNRIPDLDTWLKSITRMISNGKLKTTQDNELFGQFLAKIGSNADLVNYFTKPITQISATEALAFRSSTFADIISDRLVAGMEDLEESDKEKTTKALPEIDPDKMLLEIANPSETMSDYIYRETVASRISMILDNPPANAKPNDLLMLKRWRAKWLYLASISCLRDFLTRISLRLSM